MGIVEAHDLLQGLEIAVVRVSFDKAGLGSQIYVAQGRRLLLVIVLRSAGPKRTDRGFHEGINRAREPSALT